MDYHGRQNQLHDVRPARTRHSISPLVTYLHPDAKFPMVALGSSVLAGSLRYGLVPVTILEPVGVSPPFCSPQTHIRGVPARI